jgi:26S proteasome regulatory subunit N7
MGSDPQFAKYPNLGLAQSIFSLATDPALSKSIQNAIQEQKMAPLYRHLAHPAEGILNSIGENSVQSPGPKTPTRRESIISSNLLPARRQGLTDVLPWDASLYKKLKAENDEELAAIQEEEEAAEENAGETEIQAARGKRAEFWARVGDKVENDGRSLRWVGHDADRWAFHSRTNPSVHMRRFSKRPVRWGPR